MTQQKTRATTLQQKFGFQDADLSTPVHDALMVWLDQNVEDFVLKQHQPNDWPADLVQKCLDEMRDKVEAITQEWELAEQKYRDDQSWGGQRYYEEAVSALAQCRAWTMPTGKMEVAINRGNGYWSSEKVDSFSVRARIAQKIWEHPIMTGKEFMVGFVDMMVRLDWFEDLSYSYRNEKDRLPGGWTCLGKRKDYLFEVKPSIPSVGELIRQIRMYQQYQAGTYIVVSPDDRFASILAGQGIEFLKAPNP